MALSTDDNPLVEKSKRSTKPELVAEPTTAVEPAPEDFPLLPTAYRGLQPASESSNPEVHRLMSLRRTAARHNDDDRVVAIDAELATHGVAF